MFLLSGFVCVFSLMFPSWGSVCENRFHICVASVKFTCPIQDL